MEKQEFSITFETDDDAKAGLYAEELRKELLDASAEIEVKRKNDDPHAQNMGHVLVLLLGAPATAVAINAIKDYLLYRKAKITIKSGDEELTLEGISRKDAVKLAQLAQFLQKKPSQEV